MLKPLADLPLAEHGVTTVPSYREHRCDLKAAGHLRLRGVPYRFDNRRRHEQACVLQVTVAGSGLWQEGRGKEEALGEGEVFLTALPSDSAYRLDQGATWQFAYLYFGGDLATYHVQQIIARRGHRFHIGDHDPLATALADLLTVIFERRGDEFLVSGLLYACLLQAYPRLHAASGNDGLTRARRHAERHFAERNLGVDDLAEVAGMSRFHFSRLFKRSAGVTPYAYLIDLRIRKALDLLATSDLAAAEIAGRVGFGDYPYFCTTFKRHVGTTPKRFRDRVRADGARRHSVV